MKKETTVDYVNFSQVDVYCHFDVAQSPEDDQ